MNDFAYVAIFLAFFVVAGLFVKACDLIIGPDEADLFVAAPTEAAEAEQAAA